MAQLSALDAVQTLLDAGFTYGGGIINALAVSFAESRWITDARHTNDDGTVDRGWFQLNSKWHAEVSDACADDPLCAAKAAFRISSNGTSWSAWSTFTSGAYKTYLILARTAWALYVTTQQLSGARSDLAAANQKVSDLQGCLAADGQHIDSLEAKISAAQAALA